MTKKAIYKHKKSGDLFAIETDEDGKVVSSCGPLLSSDIDAEMLDYDNYWGDEIEADMENFVLLSKAKYMELLAKYGFCSQPVQLSLFDELQSKKGRK
jgi:hypothetical protein